MVWQELLPPVDHDKEVIDLSMVKIGYIPRYCVPCTTMIRGLQEWAEEKLPGLTIKYDSQP